MKIFEITEGERHGNDSTYDKCWTGYRKVPGKTRGEKGSCVKEETGPSGADMLAKGAAILSNIDMALDGSGLKRQGFELVKDTNSFTRGSITREAEASIRNSLAKAKALLGGVEPEDPKPTMTKAELARQEFGEEASAGSTGAGDLAAVANPTSANAKIKRDKNGVPVAPQKKNPDGTAKNALELSNNLMGGKAIKR